MRSRCHVEECSSCLGEPMLRAIITAKAPKAVLAVNVLQACESAHRSLARDQALRDLRA